MRQIWLRYFKLCMWHAVNDVLKDNFGAGNLEISIKKILLFVFGSRNKLVKC